MSPAVPPEVRAYLALQLERKAKGRPPYRSWLRLAKRLGFRHATLVDVADWLEARGVLTMPRLGICRQWKFAVIDTARARALLEGRA